MKQLKNVIIENFGQTVVGRLLHNSLNVVSPRYLVDGPYYHCHSGSLRSVTNERFSH